ncbi:MAG: hypothetical protein HY675_13075 [Chloroflexi bacterium]|nr:hypothetical protein [Chloroflexota bacterium]
METLRATSTWSPTADRYCLWAEDVAGSSFVPEPIQSDPLAALLLEVDEAEQETGRIAGFEIIGFLTFDHWESLPKLDVLWQLPGREPLPLDQLLKRVQKELRRRKVQEAA